MGDNPNPPADPIKKAIFCFIFPGKFIYLYKQLEKFQQPVDFQSGFGYIKNGFTERRLSLSILRGDEAEVLLSDPHLYDIIRTSSSK
jgi:hypothetical protein